MSFRDALKSGKRLLFDGAMGTMLQRRGLPAGESPEGFCLANPDILEGVHADYVRAGADVLTTNTFGGTHYKLEVDMPVAEFNRRMARAAKNAASSGGRKVYVAGSIGPTGKFLHPLGDVAFEDMVTAFREQIRGLIDGGVDCIIAETQFDIAEARAAVIAVRRECDLPAVVSMTYEAGITLTGSSVAVCCATLANLGADLVGMNCSAGPEEMAEAATELLASCPVPVIIQPNAGLPLLEEGKTIFPLGPDRFSSLTAAFAEQGAQVVGGCCGTSPDHIAALRKRIDALPPVGVRPQFAGIAVTSRSGLVRLGEGYPLAIIGERINPTGKKVLTAQLQNGQFGEALRFAEEQVERGASILDVNTGAPMVDETVLLPELTVRLVAQHKTPLSLDSPNPQAIANALTVYPASPLVNSISGEAGRLEMLGPVCKEFGAPFILLPLKGTKLPVKAAERIAILEALLSQMEAMGIPRRLAIVDILVLSASSNREAAEECLKVIRYCRDVLQLPTTGGLSNISFGLPARELLNTTFFTLAAGAGLSSCIANPSSVRLCEAVESCNLLLGRDKTADAFIAGYAGWASGSGSGTAPATPPSGRQGTEGQTPGGNDPFAGKPLESAVIAGRLDGIADLVRKALDEGEDPFVMVSEKLIPAITEVGKKYERKEYFLPQLIRSAETMQAAFAVVKPLLEKQGGAEKRPVIILATVEGDIHDIGKNIVSLMLGNHGFEVVDLGKDVSAERIVEAALQHKAALVGLSALMTTTMVRMEDTVQLLQQRQGANLPAVMVGGAVVTDAFARSIGAHYARDAVDAVRLAQELTTQVQ